MVQSPRLVRFCSLGSRQPERRAVEPELFQDRAVIATVQGQAQLAYLCRVVFPGTPGVHSLNGHDGVGRHGDLLQDAGRRRLPGQHFHNIRMALQEVFFVGYQAVGKKLLPQGLRHDLGLACSVGGAPTETAEDLLQRGLIDRLIDDRQHLQDGALGLRIALIGFDQAGVRRRAQDRLVLFVIKHFLQLAGKI